MESKARFNDARARLDKHEIELLILPKSERLTISSFSKSVSFDAIDGLKSALRACESGLDNVKVDYVDLFNEMGSAAGKAHEEAIEAVR